MKKQWLILWLVVFLHACGGGGSSGGGGGNSNSGSAWLSFSPQTIAVHAYAGESTTINVRATSSKTFATPIQIGIIDTIGVITTDISISAISETTYGATLHTSPSLSVGAHTGSLEIRVCEDAPQICQKPVSGSPFHLPYNIVVESGIDLKTLSPWPAVSAWSTFQGNAAHTGYVPVTLDASKFSRRWTWKYATTDTGWAYTMSPPVIDSGVIYTVNGTPGTNWSLLAISESTGQTLWKYSFGSQQYYRVNPPAVAQGKIYLTSDYFGSDGTFWVFDQTSGAVLAQQSIGSQFGNYLAPTVQGDGVYTAGGHDAGSYKIDPSSYDIKWASVGAWDDWTPSVNDQYAYAIYAGQLSAIRKTDGGVDYSIPITDFSVNGNWAQSMVVLDGTSNAFSVQNALYDDNSRLVCFNLGNRSVKWDVSDLFNSLPALANNTLYITTQTALEARSADTGALLWSWSPPDGFYPEKINDVLATNNLIFFSNGWEVYAVDTVTHQPVWQYPKPGDLAISADGVLYINSPDGVVAAINIK